MLVQIDQQQAEEFQEHEDEEDVTDDDGEVGPAEDRPRQIGQLDHHADEQQQQAEPRHDQILSKLQVSSLWKMPAQHMDHQELRESNCTRLATAWTYGSEASAAAVGFGGVDGPMTAVDGSALLARWRDGNF
jgi:hypothetical protein